MFLDRVYSEEDNDTNEANVACTKMRYVYLVLNTRLSRDDNCRNRWNVCKYMDN